MVRIIIVIIINLLLHSIAFVAANTFAVFSFILFTCVREFACVLVYIFASFM